MATQNEILFLLTMRDQASVAIQNMTVNITQMGAAANTASASMSSLVGAAAGIATAFAAFEGGNAVIRNTVGTFTTYEQAMATVQKTAVLTGAQIEEFSKKFDQLAQTLPVSVKTLGEIAGAAGSLGVTGTPELLAITKAVAELGTTTNLSGETAVKSLVRMLNVFHESPLEVDRLASQIIRLDNTTAATASEIAHIATEVSLATSAFNIGSGAAAAIGASLAELGVRGELGGTAVGRVFASLQKSVTGDLPKGLAVLTQLFKENGDQLKAAFAKDPAQFFVDFITHLHDSTTAMGNQNKVLADLGLSQAQTNKSIVPLIENYANLQIKMAAVRDESVHMTAQAREFDIFVQTQDAKLKILSNSWDIFGKNIGASISGQTKGAIDGLTHLIQQLDQYFTSLSPNTQKFITDMVLLGSTVATTGTAVLALVQAFRLLTIGLAAGPIGLATAAIVTLGVGILALNGYFDAGITLTQGEADKLQALAEGGDKATQAIGNLNRAEQERLQMALSAKINEESAAVGRMSTQLTALSDTFVGALAAANGFADPTNQKLKELTAQFTDGKLTVDQYENALLDLKKTDPSLADQIAKILGVTQQWNAALTALKNYQQQSLQLQNTPAGNGNTEQFGPPAPKTQPRGTADSITTSAPKAKNTEAHDQSVADFLKQTDQKIAALKSEADAYAVSKEASFAANLAAKEAAEVDAVEKRGIDLKIPAIHQMAEAYAAALKARDQAKINQDVQQETDNVQKQINLMAEEDAALAKGSAAYNTYKKSRTIDNDSQAIADRIIKLGGEADAAKAVADAYKEAALAHAAAQDAAEKNNKVQQESQQFAKDLSSEVLKTADALLFQGKSATQAADDFAKAVAQMVVKALILKPLQQQLDSFLGGIFGNGTQSGGSQGTGGISGGGLLQGIMKLFGGGDDAGTSVNAAGDLVDSGSGEILSSASEAGADAIASELHTGGIVGEDGVTRAVNSAMFNNAPRYHTGLQSDELAAILQRGERVVTASQNSQMMGTMGDLIGQVQQSQGSQQSGPPIVFNIATPNADSFQASQSQIYAKANAAMARATKRN